MFRLSDRASPLASALSFLFAAIALLLCGAIFGFFYAYSVSVMWGLDSADPRSAIAAMRGINRVVRNAAFAPAFFGTPLALLASATLAYATGAPRRSHMVRSGRHNLFLRRSFADLSR